MTGDEQLDPATSNLEHPVLDSLRRRSPDRPRAGRRCAPPRTRARRPAPRRPALSALRHRRQDRSPKLLDPGAVHRGDGEHAEHPAARADRSTRRPAHPLARRAPGRASRARSARAGAPARRRRSAAPPAPPRTPRRGPRPRCRSGGPAAPQRSTWARNSWPSPAPCAAPSIRPGMSARTSWRSSDSSVPSTGSTVVNGYAATFGAARVSRRRSDDLPAFGWPTRPASASSLRRSSIQPDSPSSPRSAKRGAWRVELAKRLLPWPPRPAGRHHGALAGLDEVVAAQLEAVDLGARRHQDRLVARRAPRAAACLARDRRVRRGSAARGEARPGRAWTGRRPPPRRRPAPRRPRRGRRGARAPRGES